MTNDIPDSITEAALETREERHRRLSRVPFPLLDGAFFFYPFSAMEKLETAADALRPGVLEKAGTFGLVEMLLLQGNARMVRAAVDFGLKRLNADGKPEPYTGIDLDTIDWPQAAVVEPALEAVCFAVHGRSYREMLAEAEKLANALTANQ